jgi:hypothetical protein
MTEEDEEFERIQKRIDQYKKNPRWKEWVELTDDEVFEIANFCRGQDIFAFAKEIGRKLKEKNT